MGGAERDGKGDEGEGEGGRRERRVNLAESLGKEAREVFFGRVGGTGCIWAKERGKKKGGESGVVAFHTLLVVFRVSARGLFFGTPYFILTETNHKSFFTSNMVVRT